MAFILRIVDFLFSPNSSTQPTKRCSNRSENVLGPQSIDNPDDRFWGFHDVDPQEGLTCPICLQVYTSPVRTLSGDFKLQACPHVFCHKCILEYVNKNSYHDCPICRTPWKRPIIFKPDHDTLLRLNHVTVLCKLCGDHVPYQDRAEHRVRCPDHIVTTPRMVHCSQCNREFPTLYAKRCHESDCARTELVSCACCSKKVLRRHLFDHQRNCNDDKFYKTPQNLVTSSSSTRNGQSIYPLIVAGLILVLAVSTVGMYGFLAALR